MLSSKHNSRDACNLEKSKGITKNIKYVVGSTERHPENRYHNYTILSAASSNFTVMLKATRGKPVYTYLLTLFLTCPVQCRVVDKVSSFFFSVLYTVACSLVLSSLVLCSLLQVLCLVVWNVANNQHGTAHSIQPAMS